MSELIKIFTSLNFEQLVTAGAFIAFLLYQNYIQRKDITNLIEELKIERQKLQEVMQRIVDGQSSDITQLNDSIRTLHAVLDYLKGGVK